MVWLRVRFDGGQLVLADLTRRHRRVRAYQAVGRPTPEQVYPCAIRVTGLGRLRTLGLVLALQARFNHGTEVRRDGRDVIIRLGVARDRLQSEQLQLLMQFEHRFEPPLLSYDGGKLTVHLQPRAGTDARDLVRKVPGLDVEVLEELDQAPWRGLEPTIPARRPWWGLRHPPQAGS